MTTVSTATVAYMIVGIVMAPHHQSADAFRYETMRACELALAKTRVALKPHEGSAALSIKPFCTTSKPEWWRP